MQQLYLSLKVYIPCPVFTL